MSSDILARIDSGYADLSPQEQRAADFILDHLADLAAFSATEIAAGSGVSKATVSRLFRRLGFADAQEVRDQARASRGRGVPVGAAGDTSTQLASEHANLQAMLHGIADGRLDRAVSLIAAARQVVVIGFRNGYPVALHLRQQLAQARDDVRLAPQPGQSIAEEIAALTVGDAVVLLGFRRRPVGFGSLVRSLSERRIPTVLITEAPPAASPPAAFPPAAFPPAAFPPAAFPPATAQSAAVASSAAAAQSTAEPVPSAPSADAPTLVRLVAPIDSPSPFDSYAAPMSLASLLAAGVLAADPRAARARIAGITRLYASLNELE